MPLSESPSRGDELRVPVRRAHVEVHTKQERRAVVLVLAPDSSSLSERTRPLDVVNASARSFALRAGGKLAHVSKAHVERIEELR